MKQAGIYRIYRKYRLGWLNIGKYLHGRCIASATVYNRLLLSVDHSILTTPFIIGFDKRLPLLISFTKSINCSWPEKSIVYASKLWSFETLHSPRCTYPEKEQFILPQLWTFSGQIWDFPFFTIYVFACKYTYIIYYTIKIYVLSIYIHIHYTYHILYIFPLHVDYGSSWYFGLNPT